MGCGSYLFHHDGILLGGGTLLLRGAAARLQGIGDEFVDAGCTMHRTEEQSLQHAAVDAEQRVQCEQ